MPGLKTFALTVTLGGGSRWETPDRAGWSHFLEHLVFKGAGEMDSREIVERIEREGGNINAATGHERTAFEVRGLDGSLDTALQVAADLVLRPTLDPDEIEREKDVVAQEIAEAFDTPDDHVFEMAQDKAYPGQALGRPILGSVAALKPARRDAVEAWRAALYAPDRMVVAVSGSVDAARLVEAVAARFGDAAAAPAPEAPEPATFGGGHAVLRRRIEQANVVFLAPACGVADPAFPATRLLAEILGGGMASRLFQKAREELGLAYAVDAWLDCYAETGLLGVYAGCAPDRAGALARVCADQLADLARNGPTEDELARAKAVLIGGLMMSDESPAARAGRAATQTLIFGAPVATEASVARLRAQGAEDVRRAAALSLSGTAATAVLGPAAAHGAGTVFADALAG
ncbi:MAG: insulinase family protein [Alphaproteobacteria bacterium]|nr:insulinase family protein [Alphaproteobacteria bacterium]MBU1525051.1 insulinase family protein [Alphaproteobacteria bacterium]MBU2351363.1 insulinase family protein [Alphaproteobacteria bacterium]MBU2383582.1 insulinase family protein [Alphaproteobacteria bacterium]